jgi:hypothetical protein
MNCLQFKDLLSDIESEHGIAFCHTQVSSIMVSCMLLVHDLMTETIFLKTKRISSVQLCVHYVILFALTSLNTGM